MYIPFRKVYRAFDELKNLSDEECEKHLRRVRLRPARLAPVPWIAGVAAGGACLAFILWSIDRRTSLRMLAIEDIVTSAGWMIGVPVAVVLAGLLAGLLARDAVLLHLLRKEVHKARCPKCGQSLLGLPITFRSLGPPEPGDARVRCPECGRQWVLFDIGLTPSDLVPWEMRGVPEDYGKVRRGGAWAGR